VEQLGGGIGKLRAGYAVKHPSSRVGEWAAPASLVQGRAGEQAVGERVGQASGELSWRRKGEKEDEESEVCD